MVRYHLQMELHNYNILWEELWFYGLRSNSFFFFWCLIYMWVASDLFKHNVCLSPAAYIFRDIFFYTLSLLDHPCLHLIVFRFCILWTELKKFYLFIWDVFRFPIIFFPCDNDLSNILLLHNNLFMFSCIYKNVILVYV